MNVKVQLAIAGGVGLIAGAAVGYLVANKKAEAKWRKISDAEVESVKDAYNLLRGIGKYEDPAEAAAAFRERSGFVERLDELQYLATTDGDVTEEVEDAPDKDLEPEEKEAYSAWGDSSIKASSFEGYSVPEGLTKGLVPGPSSTPEELSAVQEVLDKANETVDKTKPYLITGAEMFEQEHDYTKSTITYYQGDQTLADERDEIIHKVEETVGVESLKSFGSDPMDPDVVYVRNHQLLTDFEILRNNGTFIGEVHGIHMQNGD